MDVKKLENVLFFKGLGNFLLAEEILAILKEYFGFPLQVGHIDHSRWRDGELEDRFPAYNELDGKTIVFFECLKEESDMLRFLQLCWAATHQYGARQIVAVLSFMHYRRQDRVEYVHEISRNEWLARQMKFSGISHVILATPHSDQTRINFEKVGITFKEVDPSDLFARTLRPLLPESGCEEKAYVYAPDEGSIPRAIKLAVRLGLGVLFSLKNRGFNNETEIIEADRQKITSVKERFSSFPNLEYATPELVMGATVIMVEDEIDSGGTAMKQGSTLRKFGARIIYMIFTHPVCTHPWKRTLFGDVNPFSSVFVCNTIPRGAEGRTGGKIHDISIAGEMASEVYRMIK